MSQENIEWTAVLDMLKSQLSKPSFETWLKNTKASKDGNRWTIMAPNGFARDWLAERYGIVIKQTIYQLTNEVAEVEIVNGENDDAEHDNRIMSIINQIDVLTFNEREKFFVLLKDKYPQDRSIKHEEKLTNENKGDCFNNFNESSTNMKMVEDVDRISKLETNLESLRYDLEKIERELQSLREQNFSDGC